MLQRKNQTALNVSLLLSSLTGCHCYERKLACISVTLDNSRISLILSIASTKQGKIDLIMAGEGKGSWPLVNLACIFCSGGKGGGEK